MSYLDLLSDRLILFVPLLLSLTVHEWAHAWTAWRLGDDTARLMGRVSLNPLDHIDPVGTLLLPLLGVPFGWAKPVPINPVRFRTRMSMSIGVMLTAAAGPAANLILAAASCTLLVAFAKFAHPGLENGFDRDTYAVVYQLLQFTVMINIVLACFNLLPIPPLDGSRIVDAFVPASVRPLWNQFSAIGPLVLLAIILLPSLLGVSMWSSLLRGVMMSLQHITGS